MEDFRVVELRHRSELAEFSGELHEGEIPPAKGKGTGCELHRREGESVLLYGRVFCHGCARGCQERGGVELRLEHFILQTQNRDRWRTGTHQNDVNTRQTLTGRTGAFKDRVTRELRRHTWNSN